jgi:hypothetical protein
MISVDQIEILDSPTVCFESWKSFMSSVSPYLDFADTILGVFLSYSICNSFAHSENADPESGFPPGISRPATTGPAWIAV